MGGPQKPKAGTPVDVAQWATASAVAEQIQALGDGFSDAAKQSASEAALQARRLLEVQNAGETLAQVVNRWGGTGAEQFTGRIFEWQQAATFNVNAVDAGGALRAMVTEFPDVPGVSSSPHSPIDLGVVDGNGDWIVSAQAKVLGGAAQRLHQLAQDKYQDLALLVPSDHKDATEALIDGRTSGASPGFLKAEAYESVRGRLTDRLTAGGVSSESISSEELKRVAQDPQRHLREWQQREGALRTEALDDQAREEQLAQWMTVASVAGAACAAGATAAATTAFVRSVSQIAAVRSGDLTPTAAAMSAASDAAAAFGRGALVGGGGQTIALVGQQMGLPDALGGGTLPFAIARAGLSLGEISVAYARGQISGQEAAQKSAESVSRISVAWAGSLVGQVLIPIPIVGAVIGGTVGSLSCALAAQGIAAVSGEIRDAALAEEALAAVQVEVAAAMIVMDEQLRMIDALARDWDIAFSAVVLPRLDKLAQVVPEGDTVQALGAISELVVTYNGAPLFTTVEEFDAWMRTDETLVLKTRPQAP